MVIIIILGLCRIRKTTLEGCNVSVIGENVDLTYPYNYLGEGAADLGEALKDEKFMQSFKEAKYPVVLVGPGILHRADRDTILQQVSNQLHKPVPSESVLNSQDTLNYCFYECLWALVSCTGLTETPSCSRSVHKMKSKQMVTIFEKTSVILGCPGAAGQYTAAQNCAIWICLRLSGYIELLWF